MCASDEGAHTRTSTCLPCAQDAVAMGDTSRDGEPDHLLSAASGASVYLVAGNRKRLITPP